MPDGNSRRTKKSAPLADLAIDRPFLNPQVLSHYSGCLPHRVRESTPLRVESEDVTGLEPAHRAADSSTFGLIHCHHLPIVCCFAA